MNPVQEQEILRFLKDDIAVKVDRLCEAQRLQGEALHRQTNEVLLLRSSMDAEFKVFGHRLAGVEARVGNLERDAETTGQHNLEKLQKQLDEQRQQAQKQQEERRDTKWRIVALIGGVCGGSLATFILSLLLHR